MTMSFLHPENTDLAAPFKALDAWPCRIWMGGHRHTFARLFCSGFYASGAPALGLQYEDEPYCTGLSVNLVINTSGAPPSHLLEPGQIYLTSPIVSGRFDGHRQLAHTQLLVPGERVGAGNVCFGRLWSVPRCDEDHTGRRGWRTACPGCQARVIQAAVNQQHRLDAKAALRRLHGEP